MFAVAFVGFFFLLLTGLLHVNRDSLRGGSNLVTLAVLTGGLGLTAWQIMEHVHKAADTTSQGEGHLQALVVGICALVPVFVWLVMHNCVSKLRGGGTPMAMILDQKFNTITVLATVQLTALIGGGFWCSQLGNPTLFLVAWALFLSIGVFFLFSVQDAGAGGFFETLNREKS